MNFRNAFYIKLGRHGKWEEDSIKGHRLRIGWGEIPLKLILQEQWSEIRKRVNDWRALQRICESTPEDIWITFHKNQLWWCRLSNAQVREDRTSKYRTLKGTWSNRNLKGDLLTLDHIPGTIEKIRGYRGTCCRVKETETLRHLLLGEPSDAYRKLQQALAETEKVVAANIQALHWKDFEALIDLLFISRTGWRRSSRLGGTMKDIDLVLEDTLTGDVYHVQVKSRASAKEFKKFQNSQPSNGVRRSYFIVHTPDKDLKPKQAGKVQLITPGILAHHVVQSGLVNWVAERIRYGASF
jgi:hypothetical protein